MSDYPSTFDVIVIGGGHAGTEAALAAARSGASTLLLTHNIETIGQMSCNPAIGGIGKSHLVREIDALGGVMARAADRAGIHLRRLNASKGPAVRATRAQCDRALYKAAIRAEVERQHNLCMFQQGVDDLIIEQGRVSGCVTQMGMRFHAACVVLTTGTFLGGKLFMGDVNYQGGRAGDPAANRLATRLRELPFNIGRLKTGTPPRIDGKTIDYAGLQAQPGDHPLPVFSFLGSVDEHPQQMSCHITHTNTQTHDIIRAALHQSPMYQGLIEGTGPRYCPSIEDKVVRFAERDRHQIFIEPEGLNSYEIYPNGISTSLPFNVQLELVRSIHGFEQAHITRPGYAIEYDYLDPRGLHSSLETKSMPGLFLAGQINGTTGYEEAGAQGLIAGLNAARQTRAEAPWTPGREQAYIGVLIDDLITRGTSEPYRMFTSRAEYRLSLREDNADLRLTEIGRQLGLVDDQRWDRFSSKRERLTAEIERLRGLRVHPGNAAAEALEQRLQISISKNATLLDLLRRPELDYARVLQQCPEFGPAVSDSEVIEQIDIQARYHGYLQRQQDAAAKMRTDESQQLPNDIDYASVSGLSAEAREKLQAVRPETIGQAARIPGMTPAALSLLLVHMKKLRRVA